MDPMADMVMRLARLPVAQRGDGTIVDRSERALDELFRRGMDSKLNDTRALTEFIRITHAAGAIEQKYRKDVLGVSLAYKEYWGPIFETAEQFGRRPPSALPHPEDVVINSDGTVTIVGPVDREGVKRTQALIVMRDHILLGILSIQQEHGGAEEARKPIQFLKRRLAKLNRELPPRLRKSTY
jgi:hypothetical protein